MKKTTNYSNLSAYQNYTVDLTTEKATTDNQVYLIDKRLLDELLVKVTNGSIDDIKYQLANVVATAKTKEELFVELDNYIYLDKIVQMVNPTIETPDKDVQVTPVNH